MEMRPYIICATSILAVVAICCVVDAQDVYRKEITSDVFSGDFYKVDLGYLYDGERYEIHVIALPDIWDRLSLGCGYKIYKLSEDQSQLDLITDDWDLIMYPDPVFQINDISAKSSSTGHYYLLLTTKNEFELCVTPKYIYNNHLEVDVSICSHREYGTNIDWNVQVIKLVDRKMADVWNQKGELHLANREYDEALNDLDYALEIDHELADAWNNKGLAHVAQNTIDSAIECFEKAVKINPNFADAWYNYGLCRSEQGQYKEAASKCSIAMSLDPHIKEIHHEIISEIFYKYGCALVDQGMIIEAIEVFDQSIEIDPEILIRYNSMIAEVLYKKGLILSGRDDYYNATLIMDRAIAVDPEVQNRYGIVISQIWYKWFEVLKDKKRYEDACDAVTRAIEINPPILQSHINDISICYSLWGNTLLDRGLYKDAEDVYEYSVELSAERRDEISEYCQNNARNLITNNESQNATIVYAMAIRIQPELESAINGHFAQDLTQCGKKSLEDGRYDDAKKFFNQAWNLDPDAGPKMEIAEFCRNKALALNQNGQYQDATIVYEMAIEIQPELKNAAADEIAHAWFNWGRMLEENRRCQECVNAFSKVLEIKPDYIAALNEKNVCQSFLNTGRCN